MLKASESITWEERLKESSFLNSKKKKKVVEEPGIS